MCFHPSIPFHPPNHAPNSIAQVFKQAGLAIWLRPYKIISTGNSTGLIAFLTDAISFDGLKKSSDYPVRYASFLFSFLPLAPPTHSLPHLPIPTHRARCEGILKRSTVVLGRWSSRPRSKTLPSLWPATP